jgi:hypothetical protein
MAPLSPEPMRVLVTGAAGQIGYALAPMVARGAMLGPEQTIILHLLDIPFGAEALEGVRMELVDAAFPLVKGAFAHERSRPTRATFRLDCGSDWGGCWARGWGRGVCVGRGAEQRARRRVRGGAGRGRGESRHSDAAGPLRRLAGGGVSRARRGRGRTGCGHAWTERDGAARAAKRRRRLRA